MVVLPGHRLSMVLAATATAQEVLPFPPTPSASTAGLTMQDSIYKKRVRAEASGRRRTEHPDHPDGRRRAGHALDLRRRDQHADARSRGEDGYFLQSLSLHGDVLAHAGGAVDRAQPHARRQWPDRRTGQRLRRFQRHDPEVLGHCRRSAQGLRLQHRRLGQVAQHARGGRSRTRGRSTTGRPATASSTSTASSPARPRSTSRKWCATPRR